MAKDLVSIVIKNSFEIWIWFQIAIIIFGFSTTEYSAEELFWYYMFSVFSTIAAIGIVYLPNRHIYAPETNTKTYSRFSHKQHASILVSDDNSVRISFKKLFNALLLALLLIALWLLFAFVLGGSFLPYLTWQIALLIFVYKLVVSLISLFITKDHASVSTESALLFGNIMSLFIAYMLIAVIQELVNRSFIFSYENVLIFSVPILLFLNAHYLSLKMKWSKKY